MVTKQKLPSSSARFLLKAWLPLLLLVLLVSVAHADNTTVAGTATTTVINQGLTIEAPYSGDDNSDNSLLIEWDENGGDWSSLLGSKAVSHSVSPYQTTIGPLNNGSAYQLRVIYQDPDNADAVQVLTDQVPYNPLLHNSLSTDSEKWSASGGWGVAGGKYGEFTCNTCHLRSSGNLKQVRTSLTTPDDSLGTLPGAGDPIVFLSLLDGSADLGDDSEVRSGSDHICEMCHSINKFHNYDPANNSSSGHQNQKDCLDCHNHSQGFSAGGCAGCHGGGTVGSVEENFWPDDSTSNAENDAGRHAVHIEVLAQKVYGLSAAALLNDADSETKQIDLCGYCHATPGEDGDHGDSANLPADTAFHPLWDKSASDSGATYSSGNCSNLDCHNNQATGTGTFGWEDSGGATCLMCHSVGGANSATAANPSSGLHNLSAANTTAHDGAFGSGDAFDCEDCHVKANISAHLDGVAKSGDYSGSEVGLDVATMYTDAGGTGSSRGTCLGTGSLGSCHSDGGYWRRIWSSDADVDIVANPDPGQAVCNVCHGQYASLSNSSGWNEGTSHYRSGSGSNEDKAELHVDDSPDQCEGCHGYDTVATHNGNDAIDFSGDGSSDYSLTMGDHGSNPGWYCAACHTASQSDDATATASHTFLDSQAFPNAVAYAGGSNLPEGKCYVCHGNGVDEYWPQLASVDEADWPNRAGSHEAHVLAIADAINGGGLNSGTTAEKNASCIYCHPGGVHTSDIAAAPADVYQDGQVGNSDADDNFIYVLDDADNPGPTGSKNFALDTDGSSKPYNPADPTNQSENYGTCSNIDCHANAPYAPHWYGDVVVPGVVTNLTAATHDTSGAHVAGETDDPGTVLLTWNAPGDDGDLDGTAYRYEVRYSTAPINDANFNSATLAPNPPTVLRKGEDQRMLVEGLQPGTSYYFAVRTHDEAYLPTEAQNVSTVVATSSAVAAHSDDVKPVFYGLDKTEGHDQQGVINLSWEAAKDHSLPITYRVWWSTYSLKTHLNRGGTLPSSDTGYTEDGGGGAPTEGGSDYTIYTASTSALAYQVTGLDTGVLYNFVVHAVDGSPAQNIDDNCVCGLALVNPLPKETETTKLYLLDGSNAMTVQADPADPDWSVTDGSISLSGTDSVTFTAGTDLDNDTTGSSTSRDVWLTGGSLDIYVVNNDRRYSQLFSVQLGYDNGSFTALGSAVTIDLGRRSRRVMKIGLGSFEGTVPADANLAIRIARVSSSSSDSISFYWGADGYKGQVIVDGRPINHPPSVPTGVAATRNTGGYVDVRWNASTDGESGIAQTLHYDVYGSADNGSSYPYIIAIGATDADAAAGVIWDTVGDGLQGASYTAKVKVEAGDGYLFEESSAGSGTSDPGSGIWGSHVAGTSTSLALDNSADEDAPAAVTITTVETRPKKGSVFLKWTAVDNDAENHGTRASYYDIRYSPSSAPITDDTSFSSATETWGEPLPDFAGNQDEFELLGLDPATEYTIAIKACDDGEDGSTGNADDNCSNLGADSIVTAVSGSTACGICHSTAPDDPATRGTHFAHGYSLNDCAKCHGADVVNYTARHYDGLIQIGWAENSDGSRATLVELAAGSGGAGVTVTQTTDNNGAVIIYQDPDGAGGFNAATAYDPETPLANTDSGSCMNFITANATGCHGPGNPKWESDTTEAKVDPACADCHGDKTAARDTDPYGRIWDDVDGSNEPSDRIKAAPPQANHAGTERTDRYVGAHERHLNASFRFAKEDSCRLCHRDTFEAGLHANKSNDIIFDYAANESESVAAVYDDTLADVDSKGISCGSLNNTYCHDSTARWAEPGAKCSSCHGMSEMTTISHISDNGVEQECNYCHLEGHPQSPDGVKPGDAAALLINNNPAVGISYRSGGIHLRLEIGGRTNLNDGEPIDTLAEICWGCHEDQTPVISEWGTNTETLTGSSPYDYGSLDQISWVGAVWTSAKANFAYKTGYIQSIHTANPAGTSAVSWDAANGRYNETVDPVEKIRCSNCHDVHGLNKAADDSMSGAPYLRGTWMGNPYEEDGAPWNKAYTAQNSLGAVPRGSTAYDELGGYYIDQNNVTPGTTTSAHYPTSGWTLKSSAGLCTLCHGTDVDSMDQRTGEDLWLGTNGHSNVAIGGTYTNKANIFDYSHGRPVPDTGNNVPDMIYSEKSAGTSKMYGYRQSYSPQRTAYYAYDNYDWGATIDADTIDDAYHQFSCSKCHNPHASRLPKLMITNCLNIRHNTWDDARSSTQTSYNDPALTDVDYGQKAAYYAPAVNCHRYDERRSTDQLKGGWNKVTPWENENINDTAHP